MKRCRPYEEDLSQQWIREVGGREGGSEETMRAMEDVCLRDVVSRGED